MTIAHSIVTGKVSAKDKARVGELAREFFYSKENTDQMPAEELDDAFFKSPAMSRA